MTISHFSKWCHILTTKIKRKKSMHNPLWTIDEEGQCWHLLWSGTILSTHLSLVFLLDSLSLIIIQGTSRKKETSLCLSNIEHWTQGHSCVCDQNAESCSCEAAPRLAHHKDDINIRLEGQWAKIRPTVQKLEPTKISHNCHEDITQELRPWKRAIW